MRLYRKIAKLAVLLGMLLLTGVIAGCGSKKEESYRSIKVYAVEGKGWVTREDVGEMELYANMQLQSHDKLRTDSESYVQLKLDEDKYVLVEPNTRIKIEAEGTAQDSRTKIVLEEGAVVNRIEDKLSENSSYEVEAPNSTMAVRGTTFRVTTWEDENGNLVSEIEVQEGNVDCKIVVKNADGTVSEQVVNLEEGKKTTVSGSMEGVDYIGEPMEYTYDTYENEVLNFIGYSNGKNQKPEENVDKNEIETEEEKEEPEKTEEVQKDKKKENKNNTQVTPKEEQPKEEQPKEEPPKEETPDNSGNDSGSTDSGNDGNNSGSTDNGNNGNNSGSTDSGNSGNDSGSTDSGNNGGSSGSTDSGNSGGGSEGTDNGNNGGSSGGTGDDSGGTKFIVTFQLTDKSTFATQEVVVSEGKGTVTEPVLRPAASGSAWYLGEKRLEGSMEISDDAVFEWK